MSEISFQSNTIANGMILEIMRNVDTEVLAKQVIKKLPEKLQESITQSTHEMIYSKHIPKPNTKRQPHIIEDVMPGYRSKQCNLIANIPIVPRQEINRLELQSAILQSRRSSATPRYLSSEQLRANQKNVKINLQNLNANKIIELNNRQQQTGKSFRSVIELESRITDMRKTFLKSLREKEKLNQTANQQSVFSKRKKIPKQFTFDYDFNIMESSFDKKNSTIRSPLKTKSISTGLITKKVKNPELIQDSDSNLEQQLARKSTGSPQKEKRIYNNSSKRQISHFPYISLSQNSVVNIPQYKLYQNDNTLLGPQKTNQSNSCQSRMRRSSFTPYFDNSPRQKLQVDQLITQNEDVIFPATVRKELNKSMNSNGSIMKNPRYFKKTANNEDKQRHFVYFKPLNVTRNLAIDKYYKMKAVS